MEEVGIINSKALSVSRDPMMEEVGIINSKAHLV
jgi:hypothetical protein